ncbi:MAG: hypothetical protein L0Y72_22940 [Gemmataceae bacterium]|nr:hypothetical protein [Gemmataceae bacterium]MCI0741900.1 hypothetical protein [Gemmataceae bacterium]
MKAKSTPRAWLLGSLLVLVFLAGCGGSSDPSKPAPSADKPYVEVLMGLDNYKKAASQLAEGKKLKFKGEVALAGSKGKKVVLHQAALYEGEEPAVQAAELTRSFMTDRAAAEKQHKLTQFGENAMIVEGVVSKTEPDSFKVRLAGHDE